jgi:hypothetical protein
VCYFFWFAKNNYTVAVEIITLCSFWGRSLYYRHLRFSLDALVYISGVWCCSESGDVPILLPYLTTRESLQQSLLSLDRLPVLPTSPNGILCRFVPPRGPDLFDCVSPRELLSRFSFIYC